MTSAILQILAAITMLIDHIGYWIPGAPHELRFVGRIAFPIFALLFAEGFRHTSSRKKYLTRLAVFAAIAQLVSLIFLLIGATDHFEPNVLFLFCAGFLLLSCMEKKGWWPLLCLPIIALTELLKVEYGALGLLLIVSFYFLHKIKTMPARFFYAFAALFTFGLLEYCLYNYDMHFFYILATPIIALYNGKKGARLPRYSLYIFYPAHQVVLVAIRMTMLAL